MLFAVDPISSTQATCSWHVFTTRQTDRKTDTDRHRHRHRHRHRQAGRQEDRQSGQRDTDIVERETGREAI